MTAERWPEVERIFTEATAQPSSDREVYLERACAGDQELRAEVERMLSAEIAAGSFLKQPAIQVIAQAFARPSLSAGDRIGPYKVIGFLGAGGMGQVYRATDTRLGRDVAVKLLHANRLRDADQCKRFLREARNSSALNHPNIVTFYDLFEAEAQPVLVFEYVPGATLAKALPPVGLPIREALNYALQIADALTAAHASGIVHRDLKPANILITANGTVKLLDFGLARLMEPIPDTAETLETQTGMIMGTASYMSPEQARAERVDARSDIFSFGCILFEMLTSEPPFRGESHAAILSAVLRDDPDISRIVEARVPIELVNIVRRCLQKDPARRFQHADDLKVALLEVRDDLESERQESGKPSTRPKRRLLGLIAFLVVAALSAGLWNVSRHPGQYEVPFTVAPLTTYPGYELDPALSPDGNQIAFDWEGDNWDNSDIYVKLISGGEAIRLTTDPARDHSPAWSPDGGRIAFLRELPNGRAAVMIIPALGGAEQKITETVTSVFERSSIGCRALTWTPDGKALVISDRVSPAEAIGLFVIFPETGERRRLTAPPPSATGDRSPAFSPDGRLLLFSRNSDIQSSDVYVLALTSDLRAAGEPKRLTWDFRWNDSPAWLDARHEFLFSSNRDGSQSLWRMLASGAEPPRKLLLAASGAILPAVSQQTHRLVYVQEWLDVNIRKLPLRGTAAASGPPTLLAPSSRVDSNPDFSPDGRRFTFQSDRSGSFEIWVCDSDGLHPRQLTQFGHGHTGSPRWSPDGKWIAFDSGAEGKFGIYVIEAEGGKPKRLTDLASENNSPTWSSDGQWIYFSSYRPGKTEVWKMPSHGGPAVHLTGESRQWALESPDGSAVYSLSGESGDGRQALGRSVWQMDATGRDQRKVIDAVLLRNFVPSEDGLYYERAETPNIWTMRFLNFRTGADMEIERHSSRPYLGLSLSPDRHTLLFAQIDNEGSDLMTVENVR